MKKFLILALLALASCATPKDIAYFADAERAKAEPILQEYGNKIQKDDLLAISVSSKSPELAIPFNTNSMTITTLGAPQAAQPAQTGYLVSSEGDIVFPILGRIRVTGLTHMELASLIEKLIVDGGYIKDPTVTVKLLNYKISVLGEVKQPGVKKIETDRITILEAISLAGDLTIYGKRDNISIIRETNGLREIASVNVSNKEIFTSPYYYLQPNDVIYVEPNKKQKRASAYNPYILPTAISSLSLLATILNIVIK